MELTTTHKFLIVSGIAVILGWYILKPKEEIVTAVKKDTAVKKLSEKEREAILKEIMQAAFKDTKVSADGKNDEVEKIVLDDYALISDDELLAIKKLMDAGKSTGNDFLLGGEDILSQFIDKTPASQKQKGEDPIDAKNGTIDLGKIKFDLDKQIKDRSGLEKKLQTFGLEIDDLVKAMPAIAKVSMIAMKPMLEMGVGKLKVIDSTKPLDKKPATPVVKKSVEACSPMADKLLKMEKDDKAKRYTKEGMKKRGIEKKKIRTNIDANCGSGFFDEHKKQWNQSYTHQKPKISIKQLPGGKRTAAPINKKYKSFSADDSLIFV